ncbi:FMN-dependent NADH-azoreductase 1 [Fundidesulfovibrio magnetotacticus]|uniref:FMN-dependent NADH-azoreductase 1 n=1 Tax=Fundidesulfovibrio magnetotacticus TaxID=2730080 RepID=A0A6V8LUY1_9BACT|nr:NAD(P)H-dependent oxidoreductase [Fundidesulfovibrio magnetotacticus]GFK95554.1 FMN-dependent NADH-azoreductase 1 [Fundidesulfovibrio magnetotacticus]
MISVILCHPKPGSFNHALALRVVETLDSLGLGVNFHDLYAERFAPVLPDMEIPRDGLMPDFVARHCDELAKASGIVVVHPNWWGQPPAVLKGWIDRVLRPGVAYEFVEGDGGEGVPVGLLKARSALVLNTSNTPRLREMEAFGDPLELIWRNCIIGLCGVQDFHRRMFEVVVTSTPEQRAAWLDEVSALTTRVFSPLA